MKAIPTMYRDVQMRSRTEARWAEFFDMIGVDWQYEPEGYEAGGVRYLPDFWLPRVHSRGKPGGVFFEVKASSPTPGERLKAEMLASGSGRPVIVVGNDPAHRMSCRVGGLEWLHEFAIYAGYPGQDEGLQFARCDNCGQCDIGFYSGDEPPCPCGKSTFNPMNGPLEFARQAFPNLGRWEAAA
jgi:hypothetical protein